MQKLRTIVTNVKLSMCSEGSDGGKSGEYLRGRRKWSCVREGVRISRKRTLQTRMKTTEPGSHVYFYSGAINTYRIMTAKRGGITRRY